MERAARCTVGDRSGVVARGRLSPAPSILRRSYCGPWGVHGFGGPFHALLATEQLARSATRLARRTRSRPSRRAWKADPTSAAVALVGLTALQALRDVA